eukprot:4184654-Amphidinium_carterae.2
MQVPSALLKHTTGLPDPPQHTMRSCDAINFVKPQHFISSLQATFIRSQTGTLTRSEAAYRKIKSDKPDTCP